MLKVKPGKDETKEAFVARFNIDADIQRDFPEEGKRYILAEHIFDNREALNATTAGWPEPWHFKFITPGLISYEDVGQGVLYVQKPALDAMAESFKGKPIINVVHRPGLKPEDFEKVADGIVTDVFYNAEDGWYWARGFVWDEETKKNLADPAFFNSCAFTRGALAPAGTHNKVPYTEELVEGSYTHLSIVDRPRLEGTRNVAGTFEAQNSKEEKPSMLMKLWKSITAKKEATNSAADTDPDKAYRVVDGKKVPLRELVDSFKAEKSAEDEKTRLEKEKENELSEDHVIDFDGKDVTVKDLVASYGRMNERKNAEAEKKKKDDEDAEKEKERANAIAAEAAVKAEHEAGKHEKEAENCAACKERSNALKVKQEEESAREALNALKTEHAGDKHKEFVDKCPDCKALGIESFNAMKKAAALGSAPIPVAPYKSIREKADDAAKYHTI